MRKWNLNKSEKSVVSDLILSGGMTSLTASVLASRGYGKMESVINDFEPYDLSEPFMLADMKKAADTINEAIENGKKICVYGDYDCDGIMSTVMLYTFFNEMGVEVEYYIPERSEGYGLNKDSIRKIAENNVDIIVTVDNGISAIEEAELVYELGMKLIVTDHHQVGAKLPRAEAIIDPHRPDCMSPFKSLCGAGVALKLIAAIDGGEYNLAMEQFGDLAAIATVADIVELRGENRYIVQNGIKLIQNTERLGLQALLEVSGLLNKPITSTSIGFTIAPRINASGRLGSPKTAVELFLCEDDEESIQIANELNNLNLQRQENQQEIINSICDDINKNPQIIKERVIIVCGENWHHGIIGIIASKIQETYGKPCFILSSDNGEIRGSARGFGDFSIYKSLSYCKDTLEKFGGHKGAGGFTIKNGMYDEFKKMMLEYSLKEHYTMPVFSYDIDYAPMASELTIANVKGMKLLEPFGTANETPIFLLSDTEILNIFSISAGVHSKIKIKYGGSVFDLLYFSKSVSELGLLIGDRCSFLVRLDINNYNDKESVSLFAIDYRQNGIEQRKYLSALSAYESFCRNEDLPQNYYKTMCPIRDEIKNIYLRIAESETNLDLVYSSLASSLNYCKFKVAIDALNQLELIKCDYARGTSVRLKVTKKADLNSAPILKLLNEKVG